MKVLVDYENMLNLFNEDKDLYGFQGFCLIKGNFIQKIYFERRKLNCDLSEYQSPKIAFPIDYLYDYKRASENEVVGEWMPYYPKKSIVESVDENVYIDTLIKNYIDLIDEVRKFPEINMCDLCSPNILYDATGFSLIDTTRWKIDDEQNFVNYNKSKIDFSLAEQIIGSVFGLNAYVLMNYQFSRNLRRYGKLGLRLLEHLESYLDEEYHIVEILQLYKELAESYGLEPIKTLGDAENYTKKLKNG